MGVMTASRTELPDDRPLTIEDLDLLPDRIPDLVVARIDTIGFEDMTMTKPPVLAIEIASPSTAIYDRNRKKDVYPASASRPTGS